MMYFDITFFVSISMLVLLIHVSSKILIYLKIQDTEVRYSYMTLLGIYIMMGIIFLDIIIEHILFPGEYAISPLVITISFTVQYITISLILFLVSLLLKYKSYQYSKHLMSLSIVSLFITILAIFLGSWLYSIISIIAIIVFTVFFFEVLKKINELKTNGYDIESEAIKFFTILSLSFMIIIFIDLLYQRLIGVFDVFLDLNLVLSTLCVIFLTLSINVNPFLVEIYKRIKRINSRGE